MAILNATAYSGRATPPRSAINSTIDMDSVYVTPVGGRVFHVRGDGSDILTYDDQYGKNTADMNRRLWPSVASVIPYLVASRGDTIFVHQNHTENIDSADCWALVAGTRIVGLGYGDTRPTFTFTLAASTLLADVAGLTFQNCRWLCAGPAGTTALTVAAPFSVTAEGCRFIDNYFEIGIDSDQLCTTFCTVKEDNCAFFGNEIVSLAQAASITNCIVIGGGTDKTANGFKAAGNYIKAAMAAADTGLIANAVSTGSARDIVIEDNYMHQWKSDSTACISFAGNQVVTGVIRNNTFQTLTDSGVAQVVLSGTGVAMTLDRNFAANQVNETGLQIGTPSS